MTIVAWMAAGLVVLLVLLGGCTAVRVHKIEADSPPAGQFADIEGQRIHYVVAEGGDADSTPILLLHGASGNLRDWLQGHVERLSAGRTVVAMDRPGLGWSERQGDALDTPSGQARIAAGLMDHLGIERAIVVGHSYGAAVAAAFALDAPEKTAAAVLIAPATHPWPGGVAWYHHVATTPLVGPVFRWTVGLHVGLTQLPCAIRSVFSPNPPLDDYAARTGAALVLTPGRFYANSSDMVAFRAFVAGQAPRYREIGAPMLIFAGGADTVVRNDLHAEALDREVANSGLVVLEDVGHMPQHAAAPVVFAGIQALADMVDRKGDISAAALAAALANGSLPAVETVALPEACAGTGDPV